MSNRLIFSAIALGAMTTGAGAVTFDLSPLYDQAGQIVAYAIAAVVIAVGGMAFEYLRRRFPILAGVLSAQRQEQFNNAAEIAAKNAVAKASDLVTRNALDKIELNDPLVLSAVRYMQAHWPELLRQTEMVSKAGAVTEKLKDAVVTRLPDAIASVKIAQATVESVDGPKENLALTRAKRG